MTRLIITIGGRRHYLWRAVDQDGDVLNILVQKHRNKRAAKRFLRKRLKGLRYAPRRMVIDELRGYGVVRKEVLPDVIHDNGKWQNNRAEMSHQPTRQRECQMRRFKSPGQVQRFLSAHGPICNLFRCECQLMREAYYRLFRDRAFAQWCEVTCVQNTG